MVAIKAHNLEVGGSNPPPARDMWLYTSTWYILGNAKCNQKKESRRVNYDPAMNLYKGIKEE